MTLTCTPRQHPPGHTDLGVSADRMGGGGLRPVSIQSLAYVQSAGCPGGGGTMAWPQSHRLIREGCAPGAWAPGRKI